MNSSCPAVVFDYFTYKPLHLLQWSQFLFSVASIIVVVYTIATYLRKSWFEGVYKETLYALYCFILWHDVFTIVLMAFQIATRLAAQTPCDMQFDRKYCLLRVIVSVVFPSFMWIHTAITAQRVVTTFTGNSKLHAVVARTCLLVTAAYCLIYLYLTYRGYSLSGQTCYCSGFVPGSEGIIILFTFIMMFMDIVNIAAAFLLIKINRKKINKLSSATLAIKFRHRQTIRSIQQMQPVSFLHIFIFTSQYIGFEISRSIKLADVQLITFNGFFYCLPYYCFLCPTILLWLMISEKRKKEEEAKNHSNSTSEENREAKTLHYASVTVGQAPHYEGSS